MVERTARPVAGEAVFRHVFEASSDAILLTDVESRTILDANRAACQLFGYEHHELITLRSADLIHPDYLEVYLGVAGQPHDRRFLLGRRKDGSPVDVEVSTQNLVDHGQPIRCSVLRPLTERARTFEIMEARVAQRTNQLEALLGVSQALSGTLELRRLLDLILDQLRTVVEYTEAAIGIREGDELCLSSYRGSMPHDFMLSIRQPLEQAPLFKAVLQRGGPVILSTAEQYQEQAAAYRQIFERPDAPRRHFEPGSALGVPLVAKNRTIGLLRLAHSQSGFYTQPHADLALAIANQASIAIENARLFEVGEQRRQQLEALYQAEEALYRTLEPRDVLDALVQSAIGLLGADKTSVLLWDRAHERLTVEATVGFQSITLPEMSYVIGDGLSTL
ncbi:MAG: GAF domain-containing protein, partial [Chloroflexi bacterium]|nr:GAF domain-containing protein [Chloroflexota bacterium]